MAVVGSGPAALACAQALVRRGIAVTILDTGERLEAGIATVVERMRAEPPARWSAADRATVSRNPTIGRRPVPRRLAFGSDYVYRPERAEAPLVRQGVGIAPTYARGGFSTVWGAAMLPVHPDDIADWPLARAELEPYYARVLEGLPYSARDDGLSGEFPLFGARGEPLELAGQARALLADLDAVRHRRGPDTIIHGQARLAVRARDDRGGGLGCVYCGLCLSGCVKGAIHTAGDDLDRLLAAGAVEYRGGVLVETVAESGGGVAVTLQSADGSSRWTEPFERVFVAAGAVNSTRIFLASQQIYDRALLLRHSPKFVLPFLRLKRHKVEWPDVNTLAALFLECRFAGVSPHWVHAQISVVNDLMLTALGAHDESGWTLRGRLAKPLLGRLMVALCGLHSDEAEPISATLRRGARTDPPSLELKVAGSDRRLDRTIRRAAWRLARHGLGFRSLVLAPALVGGTAALGNHFGGSLPMRARPAQPHECDLLGRPSGWSRIHFVDSSVLPSIPATTLALTIMANASRIADQTPLDG